MRVLVGLTIATLGAALLGCGAGKGEPSEPPTPPGSFDVPALAIDDDEITMDGPADVPERRKELIEFLWGSAGLPSDKLPMSVESGVANPIESVSMTNLDRVDRLVIAMDQGMMNESFHFVPKAGNGRLVIVQQGHGYSLDLAGLGPAIAALVGEGYGVLGGMMPCYNAFPCPGIPENEASPHDVLLDKLSPPEGKGDVLKYFVEHLVVSLNYLKTQSAAGGFAPYHEYSMTGLSGGGFTTVLYSAIDPTITSSFPCSGSKPMYLRHCTGKGDSCIDGYSGDAEQMHFALFKHVAGYLDLYAMGAAGAGRKQVQVQIRHDSCCFSEDQYKGVDTIPGLDWTEAVRAYEQKIQTFLQKGDGGSGGGSSSGDPGWYRFEIDETVHHVHVISPTTLAQVTLSELDGDRRPFAAPSASVIYAKGPNDDLWDGLPAWKPTTFAMVGTPAVVQSTPDDTNIFMRGPSSDLIHVEIGATTTTEPWPGLIASDPAAAASGDTLDVVAVGTDSKLFHWSRAGAAAIQMEVVDAETLVVGPSVLLETGSGSLDVFIGRLDGGAQHMYRRAGKWATESVGDGVFRGFPAAVRTADGNLHMYARGEDNTLVEAVKPLTGGVWALASVAEEVGVPGATMAGSPSAVVEPSTNDVIIVARSPSGDLIQLTRDPAAGWAYQIIDRPAGPPPSKGTALLTMSPVAVSNGAFARAEEDGVWFYSWQKKGWTWEAGLTH
jgi:hypothetical protein